MPFEGKMFFIKKLITSLVIPPGIFVIVFLIFAVLFKKKKIPFYLSLLFAIFTYLLSIEPFADFLLSPLENSFSIPEKIEAQAIVVLGGGVYKLGYLNEDSLNRVLTAYILHEKYKIPIIITGGAYEGNKKEAKLMTQFLRKLNVREERIIEESNSRDTHENAIFVEKICKELGIQRILLVTSAYHMKRAFLLFSKTELEVIPYPTDFKRNFHYNLYSFLPKISNLFNSTKAIREYIALSILSFHK